MLKSFNFHKSSWCSRRFTTHSTPFHNWLHVHFPLKLVLTSATQPLSPIKHIRNIRNFSTRTACSNTQQRDEKKVENYLNWMRNARDKSTRLIEIYDFLPCYKICHSWFFSVWDEVNEWRFLQLNLLMRRVYY